MVAFESTHKTYLYETIVKDVFKQEELQELNKITQKDLAWIFDFKTLSLDKKFLTAFVSAFEDAFSDVESFQVCGMESGAIPFVSAIALLSPKCKNAFYIRKSSKKHDLAHLIEGKPAEGLPLIIVDDLINRGGTVQKQLAILKDVQQKPEAVFTILRFRDKEDYREAFGDSLRIESVFELNDFQSSLGLSNKHDKATKPLTKGAWEFAWRLKLSSSNPYYVVPKSGIVCDDEKIYVGTDTGYMYAVSRDKGEIVWGSKIDFGTMGKSIFSTPALYKDRLYFGAYDGNLYCLDTSTGKRVWVFMDGDWIGSSPCVSADGKVVYVGLEFGLINKRGGVAAVGATTGRALWTYYEMSGLTHASPAVSIKLGVVVCGCNDNFIYCLDRKSGKLKWKFETKGEVKYSSVFDEKRRIVIVASMDGNVYCLSTDTGDVYAIFSAVGAFYSTPFLHQDCVFIGSLDKWVYCFSLKIKEMIWKFETKGRIFASPVVYKNSLFIGSNDGRLYEIDTVRGEAISAIQLSDRIVNRVVVSEEKGAKVIYIGTHGCELYKYIENKNGGVKE